MSLFKKALILLSVLLCALMILSGCKSDATEKPDGTSASSADTTVNGAPTDDGPPGTDKGEKVDLCEKFPSVVTKEEKDSIEIVGFGAHNGLKIKFGELCEYLAGNYDTYKDISKLMIGNAALEISFREYTDIDENVAHELVCTSLSAFGQTKKLPSPQPLYGNFKLYAFCTADAFVFELEYSDSYVLTANGAFELSQSEALKKPRPETDDRETLAAWYNESFYTFICTDGNTLGYARTPRKYLESHSFVDQIKYCTSLEEFAREEGTVTFKDGTPTYTPEKTFTAENVYDISHLYFEIMNTALDFENREEHFKAKGIPDTASLEEFLSYNKEHYIEAE